jgi:hypothetical protein
MAATTEDRNTPYRDCVITPVPVAKGEIIPAGVIVCVSATGFAVNGTEATGLFYLGRSEERVDNSAGADGDQFINVHSHKAFLWENDGSVEQASLGKRAYIVDNQTVGATEGPDGGDATRSQAGTIIMIDTDGVWVY